MQKIVAALLLLACLAACAMPETRIYSLNLTADRNAPAVSSDATVDLIVNSPRYLTQPYIAYRTSPYQFVVSRYAKWDAAPEEMVRDALRESLAGTLFREVRTASSIHNGSYSLKIDLKRFERVDEGEVSFAEIAFDVLLISPQGQKQCQNSFTRKLKLDDRSFLNLAKGLSNSLGEGTEEVRGCIAKVLTAELHSRHDSLPQDNKR